MRRIPPHKGSRAVWPERKKHRTVSHIRKRHTLCGGSGSPSGSPFAAMGKTFGIGGSAHLATKLFCMQWRGGPSCSSPKSNQRCERVSVTGNPLHLDTPRVHRFLSKGPSVQTVAPNLCQDLLPERPFSTALAGPLRAARPRRSRRASGPRNRPVRDGHADRPRSRKSAPCIGASGSHVPPWFGKLATCRRRASA